MASAAHELYVYWRTPSEGSRAAAAALANWQATLCRNTPGLQARWLRRIDEDATEVTLMEVWQHPDGVDADTARRIADEGNAELAAWLTSARHIETFTAG